MTALISKLKYLIMPRKKLPLICILHNQDSPYQGYGKTLDNSENMVKMLNSMMDDAISRLKQGFNIRISDRSQTLPHLENIIQQMWQEGWNPKKDNINLFVRDFGCLLVRVLTDLFGGTIVFRSDISLNDMSIWYQKEKIEIFPFQLVYRRLRLKKDEPIYSVVEIMRFVIHENKHDVSR